MIRENIYKKLMPALDGEGINLRHWAVLNALPLKNKDIAAHLGLMPATVAVMMDGLKDTNLACHNSEQKHPDPRLKRRTYVLTDYGRRALEQFNALLHETDEEGTPGD